MLPRFLPILALPPLRYSMENEMYVIIIFAIIVLCQLLVIIKFNNRQYWQFLQLYDRLREDKLIYYQLKNDFKNDYQPNLKYPSRATDEDEAEIERMRNESTGYSTT